MTAQYLLSLDQSTHPRPKLLSDVYIGVDVWGRGSHGGGGFGCYKAISHIDPEFLGLSVALFGHGWTWESEQDKSGWTWEAWWAYERKLWLGPPIAGEHVEVPPHKRKEDEPPCEHGPFQALVEFFPRLPPPNPAERPFFTTFSPGVGWAWFVRGTKVFSSETGWTDVDKSTSIGDLVFPRPALAWENGDRDETVPAASADISMDDAWLGGSSLVVSFSAAGSDSEDAFFRCVWLPIQSLAITPRKSYRLSIIYKLSGPVDADIGASVKSLASGLDAEFDVTFVPSPSDTPLPGGWTELLIDFALARGALSDTDVLAAAGLVIGFTCEDPTQPVDFALSVGALSVHANPPSPRHTELRPKLIWAAHSADDRETRPNQTAIPFAGTLTWGAAVSMGPVPALTLASPEDTEAAWVLDDPAPGFAYFNVYVQAYPGPGGVYVPEAATWIGTTGLDGRANRFYVDPACLPGGVRGARAVRFYVQGVSERGRVLDWEDCVFVDVSV